MNERKKATVLITGGMGTIGRPLTEALRKRGHTVWITGTSHANLPNFIRCDVSYFRQLEEVFDTHTFDYVYHLANEFGRRNGEEFYESLWKTNAIGMRNMLKMQERYGFGLLYPGSLEMYTTTPNAVISETAAGKGAAALDNDYTISKWVNELQIRNAIKKYGAKTMRLRFSSVYGPGEYYNDYRSAICIFVYRALHDLPYTVYTDAKRAFLYIDDAVRIAADACEKFVPGTVSAAAGKETYGMKHISDMILGMLGKDDRLVEYKEGDPTATAEGETGGEGAPQTADPQRTPLEEGIARTIRWQKEVYGK